MLASATQATPRPLGTLVREAIFDAPQTARVLAAWLAFSYVVSVATGGARMLALVPGRTIPPHLYVWNLVTAPWIEHSLVGTVVDAAALLVMGGVAERLWGRAEFVRFVVLIPSLANVATFLFVIMWYMVSRNEAVLFALLGGFTAGTGALTVVLKQALPERPIPLLAAILPPSSSGPAFCARHLPAAFLAFKILDAAFFSHSVLTLVEGAAGVFVAWVYLRFYQAHASGSRGDFSASFAFDSFFPDAMQPALATVGTAVFRALVACSICTPRASVVDSTGEFQAFHDDADAPSPPAHFSASSPHASAAPTSASASASASHLAPADALPSSDAVVAQRRREAALRILEGRLERMAASPPAAFGSASGGGAE